MGKRKPPKNLSDYVDGKIAAAQLINLAMELILFRPGKLRWNLTLHCWDDDPKGVVAMRSGTFSSANPNKEKQKASCGANAATTERDSQGQGAPVTELASANVETKS